MTLQISPTFQVLQSLKECIKGGEIEIESIPRPETLYNERVGRVRMLLDEAFRRLSGSDAPGEEKKIVQYAGDLKVLEMNRRAILADIANDYERHVSFALRNLVSKLLTTMGPSLVQEALANTTVANLKNYLPEGIRCGNEKSATEEESAQTSTEFHTIDSVWKQYITSVLLVLKYV